jgi:hypothetical protein
MSQNITLTFLERMLDLFDDFTFLYFFFIIFLILILSNINKCSLELFYILKHRIFIKHCIECLSLDIMLATKCIIQPS